MLKSNQIVGGLGFLLFKHLTTNNFSFELFLKNWIRQFYNTYFGVITYFYALGMYFNL